MERFADLLPLFEGQQAGRSAAEENCSRRKRRKHARFSGEGICEALQKIARRMGVKGAVLAFVRAEGHMDIQARLFVIGHLDSRYAGETQRATLGRNVGGCVWKDLE